MPRMGFRQGRDKGGREFGETPREEVKKDAGGFYGDPFLTVFLDNLPF